MLLTSNGKEFQSSVLDGKKLEPKDLIIGSFIWGEISKLHLVSTIRELRFLIKLYINLIVIHLTLLNVKWYCYTGRFVNYIMK